MEQIRERAIQANSPPTDADVTTISCKHTCCVPPAETLINTACWTSDKVRFLATDRLTSPLASHFPPCHLHVIAEIGVTLTGLGALFLFLGVLFFFDRGLLAMGNVLFLAGVVVILGVQSALKFFMKPKNFKGSIFFVIGVVLVVWGWTLVGFAVELYGMWGLFAGVIPAMLGFLRTVPGLKTVLDMPAVKNVLNRVAPAGSGLPV